MGERVAECSQSWGECTRRRGRCRPWSRSPASCGAWRPRAFWAFCSGWSHAMRCV